MAGAPTSLASPRMGGSVSIRRTTCVIISTVADNPTARATRAVPSSAVTRSRPRPSRYTGSGAPGVLVMSTDVVRRTESGRRAGVDRVGS